MPGNTLGGKALALDSVTILGFVKLLFTGAFQNVADALAIFQRGGPKSAIGGLVALVCVFTLISYGNQCFDTLSDAHIKLLHKE
jgi:hypothetical protein